MRNYREHAILPLGSINLAKGTSKYFNVYETWGENITYELYKNSYLSSFKDGNKLRVIATSGTTPIQKIGTTQAFAHDQTGRHIFDGEMIDFAVGSELKKFAEKYGVKSILGYTYK